MSARNDIEEDSSLPGFACWAMRVRLVARMDAAPWFAKLAWRATCKLKGAVPLLLEHQFCKWIEEAARKGDMEAARSASLRAGAELARCSESRWSKALALALARERNKLELSLWPEAWAEAILAGAANDKQRLEACMGSMDLLQSTFYDFEPSKFQRALVSRVHAMELALDLGISAGAGRNRGSRVAARL